MHNVTFLHRVFILIPNFCFTLPSFLYFYVLRGNTWFFSVVSCEHMVSDFCRIRRHQLERRCCAESSHSLTINLFMCTADHSAANPHNRLFISRSFHSPRTCASINEEKYDKTQTGAYICLNKSFHND